MADIVRSITTFMHGAAADILDVVYPPVCGICGRPADSPDRLICATCWDIVDGLTEPFCLTCRQYVRDGSNCTTCRGDALIVFSVGHYDRHIQQIIHDIKFNSLKPLAERLGEMLAQRLIERKVIDRIDAIVPVPLQASRLNYRGFNQAEVIASRVGQMAGRPVLAGVLGMVRRTRQQSRLPSGERTGNIAGAFTVIDPDHELSGKSLLLVDDVTTTGATLREAANILKKAGAKRIIGAVAASAA